MIDIRRTYHSVTDRQTWATRRASFLAKAKATQVVWFPPKSAEDAGKAASTAEKTAKKTARKTAGKTAPKKRTAAAKKTTGSSKRTTSAKV